MSENFRLDGIFSDGLVLQRERNAKLWGFCPEGETVTAFLDEQECTVECDCGRFLVTFTPQKASTDRVIKLMCGGETIVINDVCFGDVFLLSGQSNMELPVYRTLDLFEDEIKACDCENIRHFTIEQRFFFGEQAKDLAPNKWTKAVYPDVLLHSAAGHFFAKVMQKELNVPIGLVLNAIGGSAIEAWMSEETLAGFGDHSSGIKRFYDHRNFEDTIKSEEAAHVAWHEALLKENEALTAAEMPADTETFTVPGMSFDTILDDYSGSLWYYKEIELRDGSDEEGLLYLGELVDSDRTYINGQLIGETTYCYPPRKYTIPAGLLKKGKNLIASRVVFLNGAGGFLLDHPYFLDTGKERIDITGEWRVKTESKAPGHAPNVTFPPHLPTGLYNASLYPLKDMQFAGVLWYQGETNAGDPDKYSEKFTAMMTEWRKLFSQELPVVCVELCDYINPAERVNDLTGWKLIQRQQREQPQHTENCAAVEAHDLGENYEIHPRRKKELGERLAHAMLRLAYKKR